jgi:hypothetical protein
MTLKYEYTRWPILYRSWLCYWPLPGSGKIKGENFSKSGRQKFDLERSDMEKLNDVEVKEMYQVDLQV